MGAGGPKQKFLQNVRAIQLLRKLEAEARPATPDEKAVLVKYVGWGAMPQVFDDRNREWANERKTLREELTDGKYEQVRSTTLNAHYTSPAIIRAMYQAAQRFGFSGRTAFLNRPAASAISSASCRKKCSGNPPSPALKLIR